MSNFKKQLLAGWILWVALQFISVPTPSRGMAVNLYLLLSALLDFAGLALFGCHGRGALDVALGQTGKLRDGIGDDKGVVRLVQEILRELQLQARDFEVQFTQLRLVLR